MIDPPVRSVRVAIALAERFRELMSGPTAGDANAMSIRIGEAQQIFPEIWGHLDEARRGFTARGLDCGEYDAIRSHEAGILGVTNMDLVGQGDYQVRVADFNVAGYQRARDAASALMRAAPDVDWVAIARAEDVEMASVGSLTSGRWVWAVAIGIVLLVALYFLLRKNRP